MENGNVIKTDKEIVDWMAEFWNQIPEDSFNAYDKLITDMKNVSKEEWRMHISNVMEESKKWIWKQRK
jgi:hypothetical protein